MDTDWNERIKELRDSGEAEQIEKEIREVSALHKATGLGLSFDNFIQLLILKELREIKNALRPK